MEIQAIIEALSIKLKKNQILKKVQMSGHTTFKAGGAASLMVLPGSAEDIQWCIQSCASLGFPYYVMGNGSNLLVRDSGYEGLIIKLSEGFSRIEVADNQIIAQAGALISSVSETAALHGLTGMEGGSGIPASIGGGLVMNAGAYGWEMKDSIIGATGITRQGNKINLTNDDLKLAYRHSAMQENGTIITSATLSLAPGDASKIKSTMQELAKKRNERQPVTFPSGGSTFKRPAGSFAAKLIEEAGLKGLILGGAQVSPLHAGFIININKATAKDILDLIELVKLTVFDHSGIMLEEEIKILG